MSAAGSRDCHPFRSAEARDRYLAHYDARADAWPVPSATRLVPTDKGETFVRVSGPDAGRPVVLLHGVWSDSLMWPPVFIESLAHDYRVFSVDNVYDFGRSVNADSRTSTSDYVSWLDQLFDGLGLADGISLVGYSLGAWIAAEYTLHAPDRLAGAAWVSPGGVVTWFSLRALGSTPRAALAALSPSASTVGALMRWLLPDAALAGGERSPIDEYVDEVVLGLRSFTRRPLARQTNRKLTDSELGAISVPVLYAAGELEKLHSPRLAVSRLRAVAPRIETTVFPGAGHDLIVLHPEMLAERILRFLADHPGRERRADSALAE